MNRSLENSHPALSHQGKMLVLVLGLLFILSGCGSPPTTPAPTQDLQPLVEAIVKATLDAIPTSTLIPTATATPLPPTETPILPTSTPTATTVPPTATFVADDPALILGQPFYVDAFDNSKNWTLFDDECFKSEITNGMYVLTDKGNIGYACWEVSALKVKNFYLQTLVTMPEACQSSDRFGMLFRAPDVDQGYLVGITCDGRFFLNKWDGEKTKVLVSPGMNPAIVVGGGQVNRIGVKAEGSTYSLYANGILLGTATDNQYLEEGWFGYFVASEAKEPFTVKFDDLSVWKLQ
jgi:hypothetical protein